MNGLMAIGCAAGALVATLGFAESAVADDGRGENLIRNADFSQPLAKPWGVVPGVVRRETEALSGDWMLSALGKNYFIIGYMDDALPWKEGEQFTIVIDARSRGKGSNLAIIHRYDKPDGSLGEGTYRRLAPTCAGAFGLGRALRLQPGRKVDVDGRLFRRNVPAQLGADAVRGRGRSPDWQLLRSRGLSWGPLAVRSACAVASGRPAAWIQLRARGNSSGVCD